MKTEKEKTEYLRKGYSSKGQHIDAAPVLNGGSILCLHDHLNTWLISVANHADPSGKAAVKANMQHQQQASTAQHSTAQHSTGQHRPAQHSTAQHSTAQHSTAQHSTAQHDLRFLVLQPACDSASLADQHKKALNVVTCGI